MNVYKIMILPIAAFSVFALSSCGCCTGEEPVPKLRALPAFNDVPTDGAVSVSAPLAAPAPIVSDSAK